MKALAVVGLMILLAFAGCTSSPAANVPAASSATSEPAVEAPQWKAGHEFAYSAHVVGKFATSITQDGGPPQKESDSFEEGPLPEWSVKVLSTRLDNGAKYLGLGNFSKTSGAGRFFAHDASDSGPAEANLQTLVAIRQADLGRELVSYGSQCKGCPATLSYLDLDSYTYLRFPMHTGDSWSGTSTGPDDLPGVTVLIQSHVAGKHMATGPSGPVETIRVEHRMTTMGFGQAFHDMIDSPDAPRDLKIDAHLEGVRTDDYAPSLKTTVASTQDVFLNATMSFSQDGHRASADMRATVHAVETLTRADLSESAEDPLDTILARQIALPDPVVAPKQPGQAGDAASLALEASSSLVNAAKAPTVTFTARATGLDASTLAYRVLAANGTQVAAGKGGAFTYQVKTPGRYAGVVSGADANGTVLNAVALVAASYDTDLAAGCPAVTVGGVAACPAAAVPVREGVHTLNVTVTRVPIAVIPGFGTLTLTAPDGQKWTAAIDATHPDARIAFPTLDPKQVTGADWHMSYAPTVGANEDVTYGIHLDTEVSPQAIPSGTHSSLGGLSAPEFGAGVLRPLLNRA